MKKKLSYRDKLLELAYIYNVKEIQDYTKSRKNLTTGQIELILKKNKIIIPKDFKTTFFKENISKPISKLRSNITQYKEEKIKVALKRKPKLLEKQYLSFSGIIVAPREFRDDEINNPDKYLLIHDVKGRSEGAIAGVRGYDLLASVDGVKFTALSKLKDYLSKRDGKKARINLYRRSYSYSSRSTYLLKEVKVSELQRIKRKVP